LAPARRRAPPRDIQLDERDFGRALRIRPRLLERRLDARVLGALGGGRLERGGETRPLGLRRGELGRERRGALRLRTRVLELGLDAAPLRDRGVELATKPLRLTRARGEIRGEGGVLRGPL